MIKKKKGFGPSICLHYFTTNQQSNSNLQVDKGFSNEYIDQLIIIIIIVIVIIHQLYLMK